MEQEKENKQGITFVTMPGEVAFNDELSYTDKFIWWTISTLDTTDKHCFASNNYIARKMKVSERKITASITKLENLGYLRRGLFDGRTRVLIINKDLEQYRHVVEEYNCRSDPNGVSSLPRTEFRTENKEFSMDEDNTLSFNKEKESDRGSTETSGVSTKLVKRKSKVEKMRSRPKESLQREVDPIEAPNISSKILPFINYWEEQGLIQHERNTKTFISAVNNLNKIVSRGTLFNNMTDFEEFADTKLSFEDFTLAVDNYVKARSHDYLPVEKKWLNYSLSAFLYNPYGKNGRTKSPLLYFLLNPPEAHINDHYPDITKSLIKQFADWDPDYKPTDKDRLKFIEAGNRTGAFFKAHSHKIASHFKLPPQRKAELLIRAVRKDTEDQGLVVTPGYLCSNMTFDHRLPTYLKNQAIFSSVNRRRFR
jgi:hypothetical protein